MSFSRPFVLFIAASPAEKPAHKDMTHTDTRQRSAAMKGKDKTAEKDAAQEPGGEGSV